MKRKEAKANIDDELSFIKKFLDARKQIFSKATLVGSWATLHADRMPDRHGLGTSDIDLMIEPAGTGLSYRDVGWKHLARLETEFNKTFTRPIHLNLEAPQARAGGRQKLIWTNGISEMKSFEQFIGKLA